MSTVILMDGALNKVSIVDDPLPTQDTVLDDPYHNISDLVVIMHAFFDNSSIFYRIVSYIP